MNKKLFFNTIFVVAGSFVVLTMASIVTVNFFKDSRLFGKSSVAVVAPTPTPKAKSTPAAAGTTNKPSTTLVYVRDTPTPRPTPKIESVEDMKPNPTSTPAPSGISPQGNAYRVEVINNTTAKSAAEDVRRLLEGNGFVVSALNGPSDKPVKTEIIDRNDKNASAVIKAILKVGKVSKVPDPKSMYDVTVIIGEDYLP